MADDCNHVWLNGEPCQHCGEPPRSQRPKLRLAASLPPKSQNPESEKR